MVTSVCPACPKVRIVLFCTSPNLIVITDSKNHLILCLWLLMPIFDFVDEPKLDVLVPMTLLWYNLHCSCHSWYIRQIWAETSCGGMFFYNYCVCFCFILSFILKIIRVIVVNSKLVMRYVLIPVTVVLTRQLYSGQFADMICHCGCWAWSMVKGEYCLYFLSVSYICRIAYADFLLSSMVDQGVLSQAVKVTYDIGCKLEAHWKVWYCSW